MTLERTLSRYGCALTFSLLVLMSGCATVGAPGSVARAWADYNDRAKLMFVVGFNNGWRMGVIATSVTSGAPGEGTPQNVARFDRIAPDRVVKLLDGFYMDPKNEFVALDFAMDLVVDQASGVDIGPALGKARELGLRRVREPSPASR